ncbi:hypothetical protein ACNQGP_07610 [Flavobacterium sp. GT2N3]|uniref:hypothetical protein n=1 Tax=unclassified Flavobacterium TaxID=196869 RepID=UPI003AAE8C38
MFSSENKYDLNEQTEKNAEEDNSESKSKILFITTNENSNGFECYSFESKKINSFDLFYTKEFALKNYTPPPELV